nr:helix-turn-helix domain-containing protein [Bacteroidota bacterium]
MATIPTYSFYNIGRQEKMVDLFAWTDPDPYSFDTPHCHDYHELMVFYKGGGKHDIDFKSFEVKSKSIHIIPKSFLHQLKRDANSSGFTIAISQLFLEQLLQFEPTNNYLSLFEKELVAQLSKSEFASLEYYFKEIQSQNISAAMMQNLCACILLKLVPVLIPHQNKNVALHKDIRELLEAHYMERLSSQQYADKLHTTVAALNLKLKKSTGKTILKLQDELLISKIKKCIYSSNGELKEIAYQFGFNDYAHFSKYFKLHVGYSPREYKSLFKNIQAIDKN